MGVLSGCKPRQEVLKGDLDDAIFAADFGNLIAGKAPKVYGDAATFFQNTHPAKPLCKIVQAVFGRLADPKEGGTTIRLGTGFGGGKTHTLHDRFEWRLSPPAFPRHCQRATSPALPRKAWRLSAMGP